MLYGSESWCLTAESLRRLANWHNKLIREMSRITMLQTHINPITFESPQKRAPVRSLLSQGCFACRTLLWPGHVARMHENRLPEPVVWGLV